MPPSDWKTPAELMPQAGGWLARIQARQAWERDNAELAAQWRAALEEDDRRTKALEAEAFRRRVEEDMQHYLRKLGVPERIARLFPRGLDATYPALRAVRRYLAQREHTTLFLAGKTDTGKSVAAAAAVAEWARSFQWDSQPSGRQPPMAMFTSATELNTLRAFGDGGEEALREFIAAPLLVLDDVGTEVATGVGASLLYRIINARHGEQRRTVVTTNLGPEELKRSYDERVLRRLRDDSVCLIGGTLYEGGKRVTPELKAVRP